MSKIRKKVTFVTCYLDSTGVVGITLVAVTDRNETVYVTIPYWGVGCVSKAIRKGMNEYVNRAKTQMANFVNGANSDAT